MTGDPSNQPRPLEAISYFAGTDVGKKRQNNEDSNAVVDCPEFKVFLIADGMGGARGGATASSVAVKTVDSYLTANPIINEANICRAYAEANQAIFEKGLSDPELEGMGTTLVGLSFVGTALYISNVGDSRAYRIRNSRITPLTEDHTLVMELLRSGAITASQVKNHPVSHMLTRSLGPTPQVDVDCYLCSDGPARGDRYVICSDGLHNGVSPEEILETCSNRSPKEAVHELIELANKKGGADNISTIIVDIGEEFPLSPEDYESETSHIPITPTQEEIAVAETVPFNSYIEQSRHIYDSEAASTKPSAFGIGWASILGFLGGGVVAFFSYSLVAPDTQRDVLVRERVQTPIVPEPPAKVELSKQAESEAEKRSALAMLLATAEPSQSISTQTVPAAAQPALPTSSSPGLSNRREYLESSIKRIDQKLELTKPESDLEIFVQSASERIEELKRSVQVKTDGIEAATRKLAVWYARGKELEERDPATLASEVAVTSERVRESKGAFENATWEYLKEAEALKYDPSNQEQETRVRALEATRTSLLKQLVECVRDAIKGVISQSESEISELSAARDTENADLKGLYSDLEFATLLKGQDSAGREQHRQELVTQKTALTEELASLAAQ